MNLADPSFNAFFFTIDAENGDQFDAYLDLKQFSDFYDLQVRYRPIDTVEEWVYLSAADNDGDSITEVNENQLDTEANTNAEFDRLLAVHNESIKKAFGGGASEIPTEGIERIEWLIRNGTAEADNVLTRIK